MIRWLIALGADNHRALRFGRGMSEYVLKSRRGHMVRARVGGKEATRREALDCAAIELFVRFKGVEEI